LLMAAMRFALLVICIIVGTGLVNAAIGGGSHSSPAVPVFLWAGQNYFSSSSSSSNHVTINEVLESNDLTELLNAINNQGSSRFVSVESTAPELLVAFVNQQFSSADSANTRPSAVKAALAGSSSSLAAPLVAITSSATTSDIITNAFAQQSILSLSLDSKRESCESLITSIEEFAAANDNKFDNQKTELIMIKSTDTDATEACLSSVTSSVSSSTNGRFVMLLSSEYPSIPSLQSTPVTSDSSRLRVMADSSDTGPLYITPGIIIGLLVIAFLLVVLFVGICATMSIQAPLRFATPTQKLVVGKEH